MASAQRLGGGTLRRLVSELTRLQSHPPEGITVTINEDVLTEITATIQGPLGTPYEKGHFDIRLSIDPTYPTTPPRGIFLTKIFHPNVSEQGEICVNTLKKDWQKHYGIEHVLVTIKCLLIYPNGESALNEEAGRLLLEEYDGYARHARLMTEVHAVRKRGAAEADGENRDPQVGGPGAPAGGAAVAAEAAAEDAGAERGAKKPRRALTAREKERNRRKMNLRRL
ncbi:ubiquitin-conjugating enzyme E2 S [Coemansia erecta]|uniref:E2 ubiquitin-conjugating enzyme n=1 Tax=Coemansia erecta TaxID=147472 RepID=A0A9W7Y891_9FUNG|nr:ubiquitin-conjugating enzyme E2 S [Coemansia erecta]